MAEELPHWKREYREVEAICNVLKKRERFRFWTGNTLKILTPRKTSRFARMIYPGEYLNPWIATHTAETVGLGFHKTEDPRHFCWIDPERLWTRFQDQVYTGFEEYLMKPELDRMFSWYITQPLEAPCPSTLPTTPTTVT